MNYYTTCTALGWRGVVYDNTGNLFTSEPMITRKHALKACVKWMEAAG